MIRGDVAQAGEPVGGPGAIGVRADRQQGRRTDLRRSLGRPHEPLDVHVWFEKEHLHIKRCDARPPTGLHDVTDARSVADDLEAQVEIGRRQEPQPDRIEPPGRGRLDLFDRGRPIHGQVVQRQATRRGCVVVSGWVSRVHEAKPWREALTSIGTTGRRDAAESWTAIVTARVASPSRPSMRGRASPRMTAQK